MIQIEKIEVSYFRSIYSSRLTMLGDMSVICGRNDVGKSNYLRALNLFFNGQTDWNVPIDFYQDFNIQRLEECRKKVKSKQFIRVKVHFVRGNRYQKSLPRRFWVSRTWGRDGRMVEKNGLNAKNMRAQSLDRAQASLQRYLGTVHYEYIPAIKDRSFFTHALSRLQDAVIASKSNVDVSSVVESLNDAVVSEVSELKAEFARVANVDIDISLPTDLADLFGAFSLSTHKKEVPFSSRGDGIQARFLPSLLHYVSENSKLFYVWGFEEPENCMEHSLATQLADQMERVYSKNAQIIVTSHSPAFIDLKEEGSGLYRVDRNRESGTTNEKLNEVDIDKFEELGVLALQKKFQAEFEVRIGEAQRATALLKEKVEASERPVLLVEGKTDVIILKHAWERIYEDDCSFLIESCSTTDDDATAGCGVLRKALESGRPNMQLTIGLFDYDDEGKKSFESLDKNFFVSANSQNVKLHRNGVFAGMLFPEIPNKDDYRSSNNLCIEFLFPEESLLEKHGGRGLVFKQQTRVVRVGKLEESTEDTTEPHFRSIVDGKVWFANEVVPRLDDDAFENFEAVFEIVMEVLDSLGPSDSQN